MVGLRSPWRRHDPRQDLMGSRVAGKLSNSAQQRFNFEARDLSDGGIKLVIGQAFAIGEELTVEIETPRKLSLRGKVCWCQESPEEEAYLIGVEVVEGAHELAALFVAVTTMSVASY